MNRKNTLIIIVSAVVLILLVVAGFIFNDVRNSHKATINIQKSGITAEVFKRDPQAEESTYDQKVATLSDSGTISLKAGKYYVIPKGKDLDDSQISFEIIDKDVSVNVNPGYSAAYLEAKTAAEVASANTVITSTYPLTSTGFSINSGKLYLDGTWYGATLVQKAVEKNNGDVYRLVLHKVDGKWQVAATPQLVLTIADNKTIPDTILRDLNRQTGYATN
jgi:hypothetical protein